MAYDLEEQEQLASLKAWWNDNGKYVLAIVVGTSLVVTGWLGWRNYQAGQVRGAGTQYELLVRAAQAGDLKAMRDAAGTLAESFPGTLYASMGALAAAKVLFERNDLKGAKAQLQWTVDKGATGEMKDLARLRLAGVLLDEKAHDEALKQLEKKPVAALEPQFNALRGDVQVAKGQLAEARTAYRAALEKSGGSEAFRQSVQLRLDALGS